MRRVLAKRYGPDRPGVSGPSWLPFFAQTKDGLWSVDLFRCESILLRSHWVLVAIDAFSRRIVGFGIDSEYIDGSRWLANLRVLGVEGIKSARYVPTSHPFVERPIGTIRREYLDHRFFWNSIDLRRKLDKFRA